MARRDPLADAIAELTALRDDPRSDRAVQTVKSLLASANSFVVSRAAKFAGAQGLADCEGELACAFERFLEKSDKACHAKHEIARALYDLDAETPELFATGVRCVQLEPGFEQAVDAAVELRGVCAFGLVRTNHPNVLVELADLLGDSEPPARSAAARALGFHRGDGVVPLLRLKARHGDEEPEVFTDCLAALLAADPDGSFEVVARIARTGKGEAVASAVWALSSCGLERAFALLRELWNTAEGSVRRELVARALAGMRRDDARCFLTDRVAEEPLPVARELIEALSIYQDDDEISGLLRASVESRDDLALKLVFEQSFDRNE